MSAAALRGREVLAAAVGTPPESLAEDASIVTLAAWDSLAHVKLMTAIEEALGRKLSSDEVVGIRSLADIVALLGRNAA